jgi:SAM-dependent methyltransferase
MLKTTDSNLYEFNLKLGFKMIANLKFKYGLKRIVSFGYWRSLEEPLVINNLRLKPKDTILDIGSPKTPFLYLAAKKQFQIYGTDIQDRTSQLLYNLKIMKLIDDYRNGRVKIEKQDARSLSYDDRTFDKIFSISCLEHIEGDGDSIAMKEIYRTLGDRGRAVITVPFNIEFKESFRDFSFYDKKFKGKKIFYQRHYDLEALENRIVTPSKLHCVKLQLFGEPGFRFQDKILMKTPKLLRAGFNLVSPLFQRHFIKQLDNNRPHKAMMACLTFVKE